MTVGFIEQRHFAASLLPPPKVPMKNANAFCVGERLFGCSLQFGGMFADATPPQPSPVVGFALQGREIQIVNNLLVRSAREGAVW